MNHWLVRSLLVGLLVVGLGAAPSEAQNIIKIGNLVDLTGPTSDQGKDIAQGRTDAVQYFNERGGVNGKKLELISVEYGFQPPRAVAAYKKFIEDDKVLLVLGYGTPDTEALRPYITKDKVPYISGSYSGHLTDPRQTPYSFPGGIDYTSQMRIFMNYVKETWKDTSRKPRVAFIYAENAYGRAPIESGRNYAKEAGVDLVDEEIIPTVLTDATSQLLTMQKKDPDFAYINTNTQWVPVVLKDSYKLGLKTKYVVNNYGIDERTPKLAGEAAEGVMGIQDVAYWGENVPGMKTLMEFHQKHHPNDTHASPYMRGWLWVIMTVEAIKRSGTTLTGESLKNSLDVPEGQIVALLGANGAGKTSTLKAISGLLKTEDGQVTDGSIEFVGRRIDGRDPEEICRLGIVQVMEGRKVLESLTVAENLRIGGYTRRDPDGGRASARSSSTSAASAGCSEPSPAERRRSDLLADPQIRVPEEAVSLAPCPRREVRCHAGCERGRTTRAGGEQREQRGEQDATPYDADLHEASPADTRHAETPTGTPALYGGRRPSSSQRRTRGLER